MSEKMKLIALTGAAGRMGQALIAAVERTPGLQLSGLLERPGAAQLGEKIAGLTLTDNRAQAFHNAQCVIDFTIPSATVALLPFCVEQKIAMVIGTTGFSSEEEALIREASSHIPIMKSGNMSLGVNILTLLVTQAAQKLSDDFDIEIVEMHHNKKIDAPSGTALMLGQAAAQGRGIDLESSSVRGRDGITGARQKGTIGFAALRGGTVIGDHDVIFAGGAERIILSHKAESREMFANGAVKAAAWLVGKPTGLYSMKDVLGL